ncbi:hypothetical protein ACHAW5_011346 [Stephanodiscus triporus]|uniref:Translation initiation factor IF2/IF5 domain-containing protein n=1 Tax=Stephanodiscus triporus TaxID=2934178 RepID=A0ABD3QRM9_9STRA
MGRPGAIVNIAGTTPVDDPEYRYKMPTVFGKLEGKGNGSKTVVPNISEVALSLHRDRERLGFFGCELGSQTTYSAETDRAIVNGHHTDIVLQQLMHKYIQLFVLCPNCNLPEAEYKIKTGVIYHKCAACMRRKMVDMTHKLCTFILAQDKKAQSDAKKEGKKKDKKKEKRTRTRRRYVEVEKKSKEEISYLEDAVSGDKVDDFGSDDDEDDGVPETVDDANAMALSVEATKKYLSANPDASPSLIARRSSTSRWPPASSLKTRSHLHPGRLHSRVL